VTPKTKNRLLPTFTLLCLLASGGLIWHEMTLRQTTKLTQKSYPKGSPTAQTPSKSSEAPEPLDFMGSSVDLHPKQLQPPAKHARLQTLQGLANRWNQNNHVFLLLTPKESVDFIFHRSEPYSGPLLLTYTKAPDYGTYSVSLNQTPLAEVDGWGDSLSRATLETTNATLKTGRNVLTLTSTGKNPASTNFLIGIDSLEIPKGKPKE
jgi:hypothetical protein